MKKRVSLIFPTILELVDFQIQARTPEYEIKRTKLMVTGEFSQQDIELAIRGFSATLVEEDKRK
ncbi:MAG: hypothetical protein JWP27_2619 [Flaviaesturariibacter sp.]|nr:hypothetical protein [Flaviaesturariibacter sp.]